ncbi:MAG: hypothetical protein KF881_14040 [Acidobacteria bacterium]|nr:hypothetical protein [Acidobacteriota bacterium]
MKAISAKSTIGLILLAISVFLSFSAFGQKHPKCDVKDMKRPKMKVVSESSTESIGIRTAIKPKFQTDENLILMARYIRQRYCEKKSIIVLVFDNEKDAREFTVYEVEKVPDTNRAIYSFNIDTGAEKLVRIKMVNGTQVETPIEL